VAVEKSSFSIHPRFGVWKIPRKTERAFEGFLLQSFSGIFW
jgi:hypothetical protein